MILTGAIQNTRRKTCPNATLSTTNPPSAGMGSKLGLPGYKTANKCMSHGTPHQQVRRLDNIMRQIKPKAFYDYRVIKTSRKKF
jgi:hypothetical protein